MKDEESQKSQTKTTSGGRNTWSAASFCNKKKYGQGFEELFVKGKYRFWALTAIVLLAFWSMFTGSITLKHSVVDLKLSSHDLDSSSTHADLDVLDVEEREKTVKEMWNAYKYSGIIRLPSFFRDAFGAAYQDLTSEVSSVRDAALLEIAKMSFTSTDYYKTSPVQSST